MSLLTGSSLSVVSGRTIAGVICRACLALAGFAALPPAAVAGVRSDMGWPTPARSRPIVEFDPWHLELLGGSGGLTLSEHPGHGAVGGRHARLPHGGGLVARDAGDLRRLRGRRRRHLDRRARHHGSRPPAGGADHAGARGRDHLEARVLGDDGRDRGGRHGLRRAGGTSATSASASARTRSRRRASSRTTSPTAPTRRRSTRPSTCSSRRGASASATTPPTSRSRGCSPPRATGYSWTAPRRATSGCARRPPTPGPSRSCRLRRASPGPRGRRRRTGSRCDSSAARSPADVVERMTRSVGRQPLPEAPWVYGPWYQPDGDERTELARFRAAWTCRSRCSRPTPTTCRAAIRSPSASASGPPRRTRTGSRSRPTSTRWCARTTPPPTTPPPPRAR